MKNVLALIAAAGAASVASAAPLDMSAVTTAINENVGNIAIVGGAAMAFLAAVAVVKWLRRAL